MDLLLLYFFQFCSWLLKTQKGCLSCLTHSFVQADFVNFLSISGISKRAAEKLTAIPDNLQFLWKWQIWTWLMWFSIIQVTHNCSVHLQCDQHFLNKALELSFSNRIYRHMCPNESEFTEHVLHYTHAPLSAEVSKTVTF